MVTKVILITGANSGVGFAASKVIANSSEKFHVIMTGRSLDAVSQAKAEIESQGVKAGPSVLQLDVTDERSIEMAAKSVKDNFGHLDALVNNAAVYDVSEDIRVRFQRQMEANVLGPLLVSSAFRSLLLASENPYSLYISSGAGSFGLYDVLGKWARAPKAGLYRASKAALNMLVLEESYESEAANIKFFAVCPGFVVSNLRGKDEEARSGGGKAVDPVVSGELILSILEGARDADRGRLVHKDGVYPW